MRRQDAQPTSASPPAPQGISRRALLQAGGAATLAGAFLCGKASAEESEGSDFESLEPLAASRESYWREDGAYFVQDSVDVSQVQQNLIRARVEGKWQTYAIREIDDAFYEFNMEMRLRMLKVMMGTAQLEMYNDAHNAAVASYGSNRGDSRFTMNVAFKGMGWVPQPDKIDERIELYKAHYTQDMTTKVQILTAGYKDFALWDRRVLGSLELYTMPSNETHTFLNQLVNPVSTLCFLGNASYEMRTIARLIHPANPNLTDYESKVVKWINFAHDFFHGGPNPTQLTVHNIGVIYYIVEEFDNSPWGATPTAGGMKRVPLP